MKLSSIFICFAILSVLLVNCTELPEEHYGVAKKLYEDKKYEAALDKLNDAIDINPDYAEAYLLRGDCKLMGKRSDLRSNLSYRKNEQSAIDDFDNAAYLFLIKRDTASAETAYIKKGIFLQFHDIERAIETFRFVTRLNPNNKDATSWLSMCYAEMEDTTAAFAVFQRLVALNPKDAESYFLRGTRGFVYNRVSKEDLCKDLNKAKELYDSTKTYEEPNLREEIDKLININCAK